MITFNFNIILFLVLAVFIIWRATLAMITKKKIALFLPFFLISMVFCFFATFLFYEIIESLTWILEYISTIAIILILINLTKKSDFNRQH